MAAVLNDYDLAARWIAEAKRAVAFTGAGISVESGIPTFRGEEGLWSRFDPRLLELGYFYDHPEASWRFIRQIFYDTLSHAKGPNDAHLLLAELERRGVLRGVITQNIDGLHQRAGSRNVVEFHGTAWRVVCTACRQKASITPELLASLPPRCQACGGLLKPDFIFFGEGIGPENYRKSEALCRDADLLLIVGTSGEVMPASMIPFEAKEARVIEINPEPTRYTEEKSDILLRAKAVAAAKTLARRLGIDLS
ncbi:SIR2 family NAD-dependent protein deacylase [Hydrogenimonas sp.]